MGFGVVCFALVFGHWPQSLRVCARLPKQSKRTTQHNQGHVLHQQMRLMSPSWQITAGSQSTSWTRLCKAAARSLSALSTLLLASCPPPAPTGHNCTSRQYKSAENQAIKPTWRLRGVQNLILSVFGLECHYYIIPIWYGAVPKVLVFFRTHVWLLPCHVHLRIWYICSNQRHQLI